MKIDRVLEAHGIGIVSLAPPVDPNTGIVTNGLLAYWNSKQGFSGSNWNNIAPATSGQYPGYAYQVAKTSDGVEFSGSSSYIQLPIPTELKSVTSATFEIRIKSYGGWADLINQDGRELLWIGEWDLTLSGIFDANKFADHKTINTSIKEKEIYLTITADTVANRITIHFYYAATGSTFSESYSTTVGTFANGDHIWISRSQTPFNGYLDSIRMYNRVLTQEEITRNWSYGSQVGLSQAVPV